VRGLALISPDLAAALPRFGASRCRSWRSRQLAVQVGLRLGREVAWLEVLELATAQDIRRAFLVPAREIPSPRGLEVLAALQDGRKVSIRRVVGLTRLGRHTVDAQLRAAVSRGWVARDLPIHRRSWWVGYQITDAGRQVLDRASTGRAFT
jgi:hypothetical protein